MSKALRLQNGECLELTRPLESVHEQDLVAVAAVCSVGLAFWLPAAQAAETAEVVIEAISKPCIAGTFLRGATGFAFQACKDGPIGSVRIDALAGDELIYIRQESGDLLISVQSRALTMRVPRRELEEASTLTSPRLAFRKLNAATQVWGDTSAIAELGRAPEYALLPELSYQLGKLGITGRAYPPSLLLHAIALGAAEQLGIDPDQPEVSYRFALPPELDAGSVALLNTLWPDACDSPGRSSRMSSGQPLVPTRVKRFRTETGTAMECVGRDATSAGAGSAEIAVTTRSAPCTTSFCGLARTAPTPSPA